MINFINKVNNLFNFIDQNKLYPKSYVIHGPPAGPEVTIGGKKVTIFCSSNYLGLANHPAVREAVKAGIDEYGHGSCGSRLVSGTTEAHLRLENKIKEYKGVESVAVFSAGMLANMGTIPAIFNIPELTAKAVVKNKIISLFGQRRGTIYSDSLNHASIIDGSKLAGVDKVVYDHQDLNFLETRLRRDRSGTKLIVSDGVFSMDGDEARLRELVLLKKKHDAILMVDDAHASGVLGENGRGTYEKQRVAIEDIDIYMSTLSKSFGGIGGFVAGSKKLIDYIRISARTYIFNGSIPPASALGVTKAIELSIKENWRRERVRSISEIFRKSVNEMGFNTFSSSTHIVPVLIGSEENALKFADELFSLGIFSPAIRWPAVERGKARIRISFMATHTDEHLNDLTNAFRKVGKRLGVI